MIPINIVGSRRFDARFANGEDALVMALISDRIKSIEFAEENVIYYRHIRENSASCKKRSISSKFKNAAKLLFCYLTIYFSSPFKYNFLFFLNRYIAVFKTLFVKEF
jgi:hypothetical protein